jgi:type I restriction enzyme S subunit
MNDTAANLDQCPSSWPRIVLGSLCDIIGGFAAPKGEEPFKEGMVPFVRMQDLGRYHRTTNLVKTKDKLNLDYVTKRRLRIIGKGSILIPRSGSVSLNHRAILGIDACIVSHICALALKSSNYDN